MQTSSFLSLLKGAAKLLCATFFACCLVVLIGEIIFRLAFKIPPPPYDNKRKDTELGWVPVENYTYQTEKFPDNKGGFYPVTLGFQQHGFRKWSGKRDTTLKTIFFIGDSYVESLQCSDSDVFYSLVADSLHANLFAFGASGYGTLQESMIIKRFIDSIKPDYVILEMCNNDFADNYWQLEKQTGYKVGQRRPYLNASNEIEYHQPHYFIEDVKELSLFLNFVLIRAKNALTKLHVISAQTKGDLMLARHGLKYQPYKASYLITDHILKDMHDFLTSHKIELVVFVADNYQPTCTQIRELCQKNDIRMINDVAEAVAEKENKGETVRAYDGYHWNKQGQKIVADKIVNYFQTKP